MYFVTQSHHPNFDFLLAWFCRHCRNPLLPLNGSICSSMQTAEPTKYNDLHKPRNLFQISRNAAILSSNQRSVRVALSSSYHRQEKMHYYVLSVSSSNFWRCPAPGKVLTLKNIHLLVYAFSPFLNAQCLCFLAVHGHQCQQHCTESLSSSGSSSAASSSSSEPLSPISSTLCLSSSLSSN